MIDAISGRTASFACAREAQELGKQLANTGDENDSPTTSRHEDSWVLAKRGVLSSLSPPKITVVSYV